MSQAPFVRYVTRRSFAQVVCLSSIRTPTAARMKRGSVLASLSIVDTDTESQLSYASGPKSIRPTVKVAWKGGKKVKRHNHAVLGAYSND